MALDALKELVGLSPVLVAVGFVVLYRREIAELIGKFRGGGPRPPVHPLPANDGFILRRKKRLETRG